MSSAVCGYPSLLYWSMEKFRAEVLETGNPRIKSARIAIAAPSRVIFEVLANPYRHADFDGSGTLRGAITGPKRLYLGAKFGMDMKIKVNYRILNTVVEFDEDHLIAWRHFGRHRWRYELQELTLSQTEVTETFDAREALFPPILKLMRAYQKNQIAINKSLVSLKNLVETTYV
jgi:hypothetical protein